MKYYSDKVVPQWLCAAFNTAGSKKFKIGYLFCLLAFDGAISKSITDFMFWLKRICKFAVYIVLFKTDFCFVKLTELDSCKFILDLWCVFVCVTFPQENIQLSKLQQQVFLLQCCNVYNFVISCTECGAVAVYMVVQFYLLHEMSCKARQFLRVLKQFLLTGAHCVQTALMA